MKIGVFILLFLTCFTLASSQVVINEIMSSNLNCITDEDGDTPDWIELYNPGISEINLAGYYLSDNDEDIKKWQFPEAAIKPGGFLLVFASGKNRTSILNNLHTNFSISKFGEPVILSNPNGEIIDRLPPVYVETDYSLGRFPDGSDSLLMFLNPSPGQANSGPAAPPVSAVLSFSHKQGYHPYEFLLTINSSSTTAEIRYSTMGHAPTDSCNIYKYAIKINSREGEENIYSEIPSAVGFYWRAPKAEVKKIHMIRARPFINGIPVGEEIAGVFWTGHHNPKKINIPVVSVISDPNNFFDYENGIYVPGNYYDKGEGGNYFKRGRDTEKEVIFSYFDENGNLQINQKSGARIHGQASREFRQKTLRLYARSGYGREYFNYPFFSERDNDKYKRILLNSTMGDRSSETLFKDEMCTYLVRHLDLDYLAYKPVIVFLNGEYWGIHFLKERRDEYYLSYNHNVDSDELSILSGFGYPRHGSNSHYRQMIDYIAVSDPKDSKTFENIKKMMNVDNYIDYMCAQLYLNNRDWPHNNVEFWRPDTIGGKWRWIFWDLDISTKHYYEDNISIYLQEEEVDRQYFLMHSLMKIPEFRTKFFARLYYHIHNTFSTDNMLEAINIFREMLEPHVPDHVDRWQYPSLLYEWKENISVLESFAMLRPAEVMSIIKDYKQSPFTVFPNPANTSLTVQFDCYDIIPEDMIIEIFNIKGQKADITSKITDTENGLEICLSGTAGGIYLLRIFYKGTNFAHKFLKLNY